MKRIRAIVFVFLIMVTFSIPSYALETALPYENYTFSEYGGEPISAPQAYIPYTVIYGNDWKSGALSDPTDFDVDNSGFIYILDNGNNRVVILNSQLEYVNAYSCNMKYQNEKISLNKAKGITVTDKLIYVCDTDNHRILVLDKNGGSLSRIIKAPSSSVFGKDFIFSPSKVSVDNKGNLYVVSSGTYEGIINMNAKGGFVGFFASNTVSASAWDLFWRRFSTTKQRKTMEQLIPQDFSSIDMDEERFFFVTTYTAVKSSMVKRVNQGGEDIIRSLSNVKITGDQEKVRYGSLSGESSFCDVSAGPEKLYACLDKTRGKIYIYNNDGYLLYTFGTLASQAGGFANPVAISYLGDYSIGVLDNSNAALTIFRTTEYADNINLGIHYQNELDYKASYKQWGTVLEMNANCQLAQNMMGKACYNNKDYRAAMRYFKLCGNTEMYSSAREAVRTEYIFRYTWAAPVIMALIVIAVIWKKIIRRKRKKRF